MPQGRSAPLRLRRWTVRRAWQWRFPAPPDALWPLLADTARFNEAIGFPRYTVSETPQPDGSVRRIGNVRRFGMTVTWEEGVPEWVAPHHYQHERRFLTGPLRRAAAEILIEPQADDPTASAAEFRVAIEPRLLIIGVVLWFGLHTHFGRRIERTMREVAEGATADNADGYRGPPPALSTAVRERVSARARTVAEQGYGMADRIAEHLLTAADSDVERMRPRVLARQWNTPQRPVIETCLAAAREGLLTLRWDLICPRCRGAKLTVTRLDELPKGAHCPSCNIEFDSDFSRNVEVTFDAAEDIRPPADGAFCLANPIAAAHIKVQQRLNAGEMAFIDALLPDGDYRVRTVERGGATDFFVSGGSLPDIVLGGGDPLLSAGSSNGRCRVRNATGHPRTLVIEDRSWSSDALTAHEVTTMQAFRDLFGDAVLRAGDQVEIRRVTLMFTDIEGSSELYNRIGDAQAYGWVREHFSVLAAAVRANDGAVVKTIGDAVMAVFSNPVDALHAAVAIRDDIAHFNRTVVPREAGPGLIVKLGLHCGPCIAVTLNDRLDYFGRTVNLAARLQGQSRGGDIVLSAAMADEPGMAVELTPLMPSPEAASLKGFPEPVALYRVPATEPA
jgi:class 3 adenylate cyclase